MKKQKLLAILVLAFSLIGCAYLGLHGKSIRNSLDIHAGIQADADCRSCHAPENAQEAEAPATSHAKFKGCLKCHNDELTEKGKPAMEKEE